MRTRTFFNGFCAFLAVSAGGLCAQEIDLERLPEAEAWVGTFTLPEPIRITDANGNPQLLVGKEDGQLRFSFPNIPGAEAIVPPDGENVLVSVPLPPNYNSLLDQYERGRHATFINALKPLADPMAGFLRIPPEQTNIHSIFSRYYEAVVIAGKIGEAVDLTVRIPWGGLSPEYARLGERLLFRTIEEQAFAEAEQLLSLFQDRLPQAAFSGMAFRAADALRTERNDALAMKVYGTLAQTEDRLLRQKSLLWAGYSYAVLGDAEGARSILAEVDELERSDENFLTYCLALGRLGYAEGNATDGLRYLSRAMVLTAVDATFKPELYYLLTTGYEESGNRSAGDRLAREFTIFYPNSPWLEKYKAEHGSD